MLDVATLNRRALLSPEIDFCFPSPRLVHSLRPPPPLPLPREGARSPILYVLWAVTPPPSPHVLGAGARFRSCKFLLVVISSFPRPTPPHAAPRRPTPHQLRDRMT